MKLVRYGPKAQEKPGALDEAGQLRDLSAFISEITPKSLEQGALSQLAGIDLQTCPIVEGEQRIGPPIAYTGHFIAIGLNYADHAKEAQLPCPDEPVVFSKAPSCLSGPYDPIIVPPGASKLDWEVELAVILGKPLWHANEEEALGAVAGFTICNDISERKWQIEGTGQWTKGKSAPTFGPLGPWLVTADEVRNPQDLELSLKLNGEIVQHGNTRTMIFSVAKVLSYLSKRMLLQPGDVITTGTPPGVGMGMSPQRFLKPGDELELSISLLGHQKQKVVSYEEATP